MGAVSKLAATASVFAVAVPAAHAAQPTPGSFYNGSSANGGYLIASKHSIKELSLYCGGARYAVRELIPVKSDGSFRLRDGTAERYGASGAPRGLKRVRLHGRFTSGSSVTITRTLGKCDTNTVVIARED